MFVETDRENLLIALALLVARGLGLNPDRATMTPKIAGLVLAAAFPERKIACIKFVRAWTGMGLKQAKEFVEEFVFVHPANPIVEQVKGTIVNVGRGDITTLENGRLPANRSMADAFRDAGIG